MRILYLECRSGVAGDMVQGALAGLLEDPEELSEMVSRAGIPEVEARVMHAVRRGISGTRVEVLAKGAVEAQGTHGHGHGHSHRRLEDVLGIIDSLSVSDFVKSHSKEIYAEIAGAEARVHGRPVGEVHFHEVGMLDAIADVVGTCMLIERLAPDRIVASPICTGFGTVECAHGTIPVPAPATAILLEGVPAFSGNQEGEMATPTGVAIVRHFAESFGGMPQMVSEGVGCGFGSREGSTNMVRAFIGEQGSALPTVIQIECNIDDMTPEDLGPVIDLLMAQGARDAYIAQVIMKKGRPGYLLTCVCRPGEADAMARLILERTSTIGVRMHEYRRYQMESSIVSVHTEFGDVRIKVSEGYGVRKWKAEHDDLVRLSEENGVPVEAVRRAIRFERPRQAPASFDNC